MLISIYLCKEYARNQGTKPDNMRNIHKNVLRPRWTLALIMYVFILKICTRVFFSKPFVLLITRFCFARWNVANYHGRFKALIRVYVSVNIIVSEGLPNH